MCDYQATACALLAQFMSQTTHNDTGNEEKSNDSNNLDNSTNDSKTKKVSENGFELNSVKNKQWKPTERIVKMWIDVLGRTGTRDSRDTDLGSELSVQRMRASVTADSLLVCFRHAATEHY